jgi:Core-2/I-Branching enzyme
MVRDPSKSFSCSNVLISFLFTFLLLAHYHLFSPYQPSKNHFYNQIHFFANAIISYICNENCVEKDSDEVVFQKAVSITVAAINYCRKKGTVNCQNKFAFIFMTKGKMLLLPLWDRLFKGYKGKFCIYVHVSSEQHEEPHESLVFHGRSIPSKVLNNVLISEVL